MSQGSRFNRMLALVALLAGLVGCAPLPIGSDSNSKSNAMMGERLSSSQNAPLPATASAFASSHDAPAPATAPAFEATTTPSQTVAPSQKVASAATDSPVIESAPTTRFAASRSGASAATDSPVIDSPPTTRFAASRDSANVSDDATDYIITSQDVLQVSVFQVPDLARTVRVDGSGDVSLPLIGRVPVRGKSILQAQEDIAARYSKSYLQFPQVTLSLVKSGQRVTVNGAVKNPTVLTLDGTLTLSMAIAQSGGLNELGNSGRVHVARPTGEQVEDAIYNLDDIQAGKAQNPMLRGGDIVVVEESGAKVAFKNMRDVLPFAALGAFLSDVRVKRDITPIAKWENGLQLYRYRYAWSDTLYVGVLAQEVLEVAPNAVSRGADGYLRVHYARLGLRLQPWEEWIASNPDVKFLSRSAPTH
jgi:polysaccharide export outer membrane protein